MNRIIKLCLISAISSYAIRLVADMVMFVFYMNEQSEMYNDFYCLVVPQFVASIMMTEFYALFFRDEFFSWFLRSRNVTHLTQHRYYIV